MGHLAVTGYFLLAWGPALVFVSARVANRAFLVVLTFTSCSLWILCALVVSAPLSSIFPLDTRVEYISTFLIYAASHEVCRRVALNLQKKRTVEALDATSKHLRCRRVSNGDCMNMNLAWGLGNGIARCLFFFTGNGFLAFGPGTHYSVSCPSLPFFLNTATSSLVFMLIHTSVTILEFTNSLDDSSGLAEYLVTFATPMLAFLITLCSIASDGCLLVLPCLASLAAVLLVKASQVLTTGGS